MIVKSGLPTYLTQQQVRQLLAIITSLRDRALFTTIYLYGLRVSEACSLDRSDLDLDRKKIRILRAKNGIPGEKPIFRSLVPLLRDYLASRRDDDPALFVGRQGRLGTRQIQALFRRYATLANLPPAHRHVQLMRHSIATHLLDAGEPIEFVQDHLGHRTIESTLVYARISDRVEREPSAGSSARSGSDPTPLPTEDMTERTSPSSRSPSRAVSSSGGSPGTARSAGSA
jgi:integrase